MRKPDRHARTVKHSDNERGDPAFSGSCTEPRTPEARQGNYREILDDWTFEGALRTAFLRAMDEAERRLQGAAFRIFGREGKATRFEVKFVDGPMSKEEADRRGFQLLVFPEPVWEGLES